MFSLMHLATLSKNKTLNAVYSPACHRAFNCISFSAAPKSFLSSGQTDSLLGHKHKPEWGGLTGTADSVAVITLPLILPGKTTRGLAGPCKNMYSVTKTAVWFKPSLEPFHCAAAESTQLCPCQEPGGKFGF